MNLPLYLLFILFSLAGLCAGIFLSKNPKGAIETQRKFYARINWKMEQSPCNWKSAIPASWGFFWLSYPR